MTMNGQL